jgi:hypothetical protein
MPTYFFDLKTSEGTIRDPNGTDLPDEPSARQHARLVVGELMQHRQPWTRAWRLDVCDHEGRPCFDLLFAAADDSIDHLTPELRSSVENLCAKSASLDEAIHAIRQTLSQVKRTIARSEGAPCVAAVSGGRMDAVKADMALGSCPPRLAAWNQCRTK